MTGFGVCTSCFIVFWERVEGFCDFQRIFVLLLVLNAKILNVIQ